MIYQQSAKNQLALVNQKAMKSFVFHVDDEPTPSLKPILIDELALALKKVKFLIQDKYIFTEVIDKLVQLLREDNPKNLKSKCPFSLKFIGIETWEAAQIHTIKFCQIYKGILVYGSSVTVDVDENYDLLAINSIIATSIRTNTNFKITLDKLKQLVKSRYLHFVDSHFNPLLYYYFDLHTNVWKLVYYVENKVKDTVFKLEEVSQLVDYIFDARTGELISELPRIKTTK